MRLLRCGLRAALLKQCEVILAANDQLPPTESVELIVATWTKLNIDDTPFDNYNEVYQLTVTIAEAHLRRKRTGSSNAECFL